MRKRRPLYRLTASSEAGLLNLKAIMRDKGFRCSLVSKKRRQSEDWRQIQRETVEKDRQTDRDRRTDGQTETAI